MAQPNVNFQLLRLYVDTIPTYDGNPHTLSIFLDNCINFVNTFYKENDQVINNFLTRAIIGKLVGRALSLVGTRSQELKSWLDLKNALQSNFGDQRNLDSLEQDLIILRPNKNELP